MDMTTLTKQIEENIEYQISKLSFLWSARDKTNDQFLREAATQKNHEKENAVINQALTDSLLNSMASLIDYYYIFCFIKMGANSNSITRVQYRAFNNKLLSSTTQFKEPNKKDTSLAFISESFNDHLANLKKPEYDECNINDSWAAFFGDAISAHLFDAKLLTEKKFEFQYTEDGLTINTLVQKYHCYMQKFYCNGHFCNGTKYNIYIDINNCLKHNIVPYITPRLEIFEGEQRGFSYFEFNSNTSIFLKPGLLRDIIELDFEVLRESLQEIADSPTNIRSKLEKSWELDDILRIDKKSGYISDDKKTLYFFVDNVLMAKTYETTFIDAGLSLKKALGRLIVDIEDGIKLDLRQFD